MQVTDGIIILNLPIPLPLTISSLKLALGLPSSTRCDFVFSKGAKRSKNEEGIPADATKCRVFGVKLVGQRGVGGVREELGERKKNGGGGESMTNRNQRKSMTERNAGESMTDRNERESMTEQNEGGSMTERNAGESMTERNAGESMTERNAGESRAEKSCVEEMRVGESIVVRNDKVEIPKNERGGGRFTMSRNEGSAELRVGESNTARNDRDDLGGESTTHLNYSIKTNDVDISAIPLKDAQDNSAMKATIQANSTIVTIKGFPTDNGGFSERVVTMNQANTYLDVKRKIVNLGGISDSVKGIKLLIKGGKTALDGDVLGCSPVVVRIIKTEYQVIADENFITEKDIVDRIKQAQINWSELSSGLRVESSDIMEIERNRLHDEMQDAITWLRSHNGDAGWITKVETLLKRLE